jgi:hypothetical protein
MAGQGGTMFKRLVIVGLTTLCLPAMANAQRLLRLNVGGGGSLTAGRFSDAARPGLHVLAGLELSALTQPISIRVDATHNLFTARAGGPDQWSVTSATFNVAYRLPRTNSALSPYVITGAGAYRSDCVALFPVVCTAVTDFGWNAGLGSRFAALGFKGFVEGRWHVVHARGSNTQFIPLTFGLTF